MSLYCAFALAMLHAVKILPFVYVPICPSIRPCQKKVLHQMALCLQEKMRDNVRTVSCPAVIFPFTVVYVAAWPRVST